MRAPLGPQRALPVAAAEPISPEASSRPAIRISATASMMPEPQMPVTPVAAVASAKPGSSDQRSQPMTRMRGSFVTGSMRTRSIAPGAARWPADICAPRRPAGRRGAGEQPRPAAEQDLGVGADVDDEHQRLGLVGRGGERHRRGVGPDMAGDAGQHIGPRRRRQRLEPEVGGGQMQGPADGEREGGMAKLDRVDADQQMVHHRVADQRHLDQRRARDPAAPATSAISRFSASRTARVISAAPPGCSMA